MAMEEQNSMKINPISFLPIFLHTASLSGSLYVVIGLINAVAYIY